MKHSKYKNKETEDFINEHIGDQLKKALEARKKGYALFSSEKSIKEGTAVKKTIKMEF